MRTLNRATAALVTCLAALVWAPGAEAQTVPFKVFITELWQLDHVDGPGLGVVADYFAKVTINGVAQDNKGACSDEWSTELEVPFRLFKNFDRRSHCSGRRTPWSFSAQVPATEPVHVKIQIFDEDLVFDDEADANPGEGHAIELDVDPTTGLWSGNFPWPQTCSRPNLETGNGRVNVCWQISFDTDNDGLLDAWERQGVDTDNDTVMDVDLPALGAHPLRKDLFVEIDHLDALNHKHALTKPALSFVVMAFANAPLANPDGTTGVQLHLDVGPQLGAGAVYSVPGSGGVTGAFGDLGGGNVISETGNLVIEAFTGAEATATKFATLRADNFNSLRDNVFRYAISGHQTNMRREHGDCTGGQASPTRRDFMVTLGGYRGVTDLPCHDTDATGKSVGSDLQQAGTLMHELGHNLGLLHGGNVETNRKPNYLSVMNYAFSKCTVPSIPGLLPGICDYSRPVMGELLPDLDEHSLDECVGIGGGLGFGPIDFDGNGTHAGASKCGEVAENVRADTNNDGVCVKAGDNRTLDTTPAGDDRAIQLDNTVNDGPNRVCDTTAAGDDEQETKVGETPDQPRVVKSFDDWDAIVLGVVEVPDKNSSDYASGEEEEFDPDALEDARRHLAAMSSPSVAVDQTGPSSGKPGDALTYTTTIKNTGRGPAVSSVLDEKSPDGGKKTSAIGIMPVGAESTHSVSFTVPANACPGDFAGAAASLSFKDFAGTAFTLSDTTPLQVLDVVAPVVGTVLTPSGLWPPNHKFVVVTATFTIKDNCDANPAVTLVSIVSNEPPTDVIGKGDDGPDIQGAEFGTDDRTFALRAERTTRVGSTGRSYTVTYRVTDASGNATVTSALATVSTNNSGR